MRKKTRLSKSSLNDQEYARLFELDDCGRAPLYLISDEDWSKISQNMKDYPFLSTDHDKIEKMRVAVDMAINIYRTEQGRAYAEGPLSARKVLLEQVRDAASQFNNALDECFKDEWTRGTLELVEECGKEYSGQMPFDSRKLRSDVGIFLQIVATTCEDLKGNKGDKSAGVRDFVAVLAEALETIYQTELTRSYKVGHEIFFKEIFRFAEPDPLHKGANVVAEMARYISNRRALRFDGDGTLLDGKRK